MKPLAVLGIVLVPWVAAAQVTVHPKVGADFEHFGETYRITDDQDTVTVINDYGSLVGLTVRTPFRAPSHYRLDADVHLGKETRRYRLDFDGRLKRGANTFEFSADNAWRTFLDGGDYSISSNHFSERARLTWKRDLTERVALRLQESFSGTWYESPDEYNLSHWTNEGRLETRFRFRDFNEAYVGGRLGRRSVPDSSSLGYDRFTVDSGLSLLFGWTASLDVSEQLQRRAYEDLSVRESSWENRFDARFEFTVARATLRLIHENEITRYDEPDELDFDSEWLRTGFQVEVHRTDALDLSVMPVYTFLQSSTSPAEEYTETGMEVGVDFRIGKHTWISISDEVGRRDYEISQALPEEDASTDLALSDELAALDGAFSDYLYNRLTVLATSDVTHGVAVNLFLNWQPEDHNLNRHDTDTRIISGGIEYSF